MSPGNSCISDAKSGAELEERQIRKIVSVTVLLTPAIKSALRPYELSTLMLQNNRDRSHPLRLDVADFSV